MKAAVALAHVQVPGQRCSESPSRGTARQRRLLGIGRGLPTPDLSDLHLPPGLEAPMTAAPSLSHLASFVGKTGRPSSPTLRLGPAEGLLCARHHNSKTWRGLECHARALIALGGSSPTPADPRAPLTTHQGCHSGRYAELALAGRLLLDF